jgi:hypothetical protein
MNARKSGSAAVRFIEQRLDVMDHLLEQAAARRGVIGRHAAHQQGSRRGPVSLIDRDRDRRPFMET